MRDYQCGWWKHDLGFSGMFVVNCEGRRGGLMIFWKEPLSVNILSYTPGHIDNIIYHGDKKWRFTGFYGHPETHNRQLSWALLRRLSCIPEVQECPWLVGGDFNEICFDREKLGGNPRPLSHTRAFREVLDACSLQDLHSSGEFFTWVNRRSSEDIIFERLDRFVATVEWRLLYPAARVCSLDFYQSDHRPLLLDLGGQLRSTARPKQLFRFEQHWVTKKDFIDVVRRGWNKSDQAITLPDRIRGCKETLRAWAGNRFGKLPKQIQDKRKHLNYLRTHDRWHTSVDRILELEREVEMMATKDELYWKQRSRVNWLKHGDRNSKYFHASAAARRSRNHIHGLVLAHGDWCTEMRGMAEIVEDYFTQLFQSDNPTENDRNQILGCVKKTMDIHTNSVLCTPFTAAEVKKAMFDLHPDKATGPDGISAFFFQKFWEVTGEEVSEAILKILNEGADLSDWNDTIVTLIPKIQNPMTLKDLRPISLCNVCYKVVARCLTNRFRPILKNTVNEFQSAFVPGRLISYNVILSFETLHWIRSRKQGQKGYGALKLDMSKAYDRVEWGFLEGMMIRLGFSPIWVEKIMRCVRTVRYSFSLNGEISGKVIPGRGLRRGDPLSPYLFVLCAHGLSSALISLEQRRLLTGVRIASSCPAITHLFFADDSLLFFRATLGDCEAIRNCLYSYEKASGQLINFEKSSISFSPNTDPQLAEIIKSRLAISIVQGHEVYLGLPVFSTRSKKLQFRYLVERVVKRIQGWGNKNFSAGGKEIMIKSVLQSIPTYAMSCFRIPNSVCAEIERECSNFWWGVSDGKKRMHWKSWKALCQPKCWGGLGFRHLETFNKALLAKQIWRLLVAPGSLVGRVLKARYFRHQDIMEAGLGSNPSYIWRSLLWCRSLLDIGLCWHVGNGENINLFGDRWIPKSQGRISQPPNLDNRKVSDHIDDGRWKVSIVQQLIPPHLVHDILAIPLPVTPHEDFRFWIFDEKGKYTVREGYKAASGFYDSPMSSSSIKMKSWWKFLWALAIPPKVKIFCWRVLHDIIPTERNLQNHHVPVADVCQLCQASWDTTGHALFSCAAIKSCWKETRFRPLLKQVCHLEVFDIFLWMKDKLSKIEFEVFAMRTWATWSERLRLVHKNQGRLEITNTDWSENLLNDFQQAQAALSTLPVNVKCLSPAVWMPPPEHKLRLDVDATYIEESNSCSIGGVVRNHEGQPILVFGRKIDKPQSVICAELLAILGGLKQSQLQNLEIHHVASDSFLAVQAATMPEENLSYSGSIVTDIKHLVNSWNSTSIFHVRRTANMVAHSIASFVISSNSQFVWELGDFPVWLIHLVTKDLLALQ